MHASPEYLVVSPSKQDFLPSARSFGVFFVPQAELQQQMGSLGQINNLAVLLKRDADQDATIKAIEKNWRPMAYPKPRLRPTSPPTRP